MPLNQHAVSLSVINLFLQLGTAVSVSACQTIFNNRLPVLLQRYAPEVNVTAVLEAGATNARHFVEPAQMPGFLQAYNQAVTAVFVCFTPFILLSSFRGTTSRCSLLIPDATSFSPRRLVL